MGNYIARSFSRNSKKDGDGDVRILMQGLDDAGKSTVLYQLKLGEEVVTTLPTIGSYKESLSYKNITFTAMDVGGGRDKMQALMWLYCQYIHAVIYVIDSNDPDRLDQARDELHTLSDDHLRDAPVLIMANKQDLPNAMSVEKLTKELNLNSLRKKTRWHITPTVATTGAGLYEGLDWLSNALAERKSGKPHKNTNNTADAADSSKAKSTKSGKPSNDYMSKAWTAIKTTFLARGA